ncbi:MAG: lytic transglycosylase domain-containing protein [Clostridia bacterium]|nr:lytic transglycosylase domain-containing protein [Clostridia bacterium]
MKKILPLLCILVIVIIVVNRNEILKVLYKTSYSEYVEEYSREYGLDHLLVYAIIKAESNFNAGAISSKGACGLMQLMDNTAAEVAKNEMMEYQSATTLYNPEKNIKLGTKYYSDLKQQFRNDEIALAAYNAGTGNVQRWILDGIIKSDGSDIENIPYKETNTYVRKILRDYRIYKKLYK